MEGKGGKNIRLKWFLLLTLLSQSMAIPIMCSSQGVESQKNYYPHPPHTPRKSPRSHHGSPVCGNPPSHGGGGGHVDPSTPPGGGGGSYTPPSGGGGGSYTPPSGGGGGSYTPPSGGGGGSYTPPSGGGGGSYNAPPSGGHGGYYPSPPSDGYGTPAPPAGIITPATPFTPTPNLPDPSSPPFITDPSSPPFFTDPSSPPFIPDPTPYIIGTCNYWRTHPALIWALFGVGGSMGSTFGVTTTPAFSSGVSLLQALANTRMDGYGELYREGTASLLNSMASTNFAFTTEQVRVRFATALVSNSAASAQAQLFKQANQRKLKLRA